MMNRNIPNKRLRVVEDIVRANFDPSHAPNKPVMIIGKLILKMMFLFL